MTEKTVAALRRHASAFWGGFVDGFTWGPLWRFLARRASAIRGEEK